MTATKMRRLVRRAISVLAVASTVWGLSALAAQALKAPTITSGPSNPTNATSATFTYTSKDSVGFQCSLDSSAFVPCGSGTSGSTTYPGPLGTGSHSFLVRGVLVAQTSSPATYAWTIDTSPPAVTSIARAGVTPTNASTVSWNVSFTEPVTGVDATDFVLVRTGLGGGPSIGSVSGSGSSYIVSASTGTGTGTLRLDLIDNDSIKDGASNKLGGTGIGNGNFTGQVYSIDTVVPPAPVFTETPTDPNPTNDTTFQWTDAEGGVAFDCAVEAGPWQPCVSPDSFSVSGNGTHQFAVRARDAAGNTSGEVKYSWKVSNVAFGISGHAAGTLYPGVWVPVDVTFTNPYNQQIYITSLTVTVTSSPSSCSSSANIEIEQASLTSAHTAAVPRNGSAPLASADRPRIRLKDLATNQNACKGAHFTLGFTGLATK